ncbi:MAG: DegT/DnrJ/EryC1/StrS family aminotransferase [Candidatus Omnitrophota bacterium]
MDRKLALLGGQKSCRESLPAHPVLGKSERNQINEVLKTGLISGFIAKAGDYFLGGPKVKLLEENFKDFFNVKYAVSLNSATAGLHAAVCAAGVGPGDEVVVTPYTMTASASAIVMANAVPVFADIKEDTYCIDPLEIKKKITSRTKAIMVVHLFGQSADMDEIRKIAKKHKLALIEDCAQSPGATYKGKNTGILGDISVFSLNQHKTITSGEGGVVLANNLKMAEKVRLIRNHGEVVVSDNKVKDIVNVVGYNYRMTELEAGLAIAQFKELDFLTDYRIELAQYLTAKLREFNNPCLELPVVYPHNKHVYFVYPFKFKESKAEIKRETFLKALSAEGVPCAGGYVKPIYLEPMYQKLIGYGKMGCPFKCPLYKGEVNYKRGLCPVTEKMYYKELALTGICRYPVKKNYIDSVVGAFKKVFDNLKELSKYEKSKAKQ